MDTRHDLTDEQWARLEPLLPDRTPQRGGRWVDHRQIIDGVLWRARAGNPWRDLPACYGNWKTVYNRHRRWSGDGTWRMVLDSLRVDCDLLDAADELMISVDSVTCHREGTTGLPPASRERRNRARSTRDPNDPTKQHKNGHRRTYPPVGTPTIARISSRYLSEPERIRIADLRRLGWTIRAIAADLGRAPSTVSRELVRNTDRSDGPAYLPHDAHRRAAARRARPKATKLAIDAELREFVAARLAKKWSPEQISHALRAAFPDQRWRHLAIETLYRAVYRPGHSGLPSNSTEALRTGRARRRPHHHPNRRKARICEPSHMIDQRPAEVDDRAVPGHWEGDLIIGKNGGTAIATLVERTTRFLLLVHLPGSRTAATLRKAIVPALRAIPAHLRRSITWDQGGEMALHREITSITGIPVYFCHPHSPWERGSNENMNGVLRQYFPKSTNLAVHSPERLAAVANEINERPRKTLGWKTPAENLAILSATTN